MPTDDAAEFVRLMTAYDNSHEPRPLLNHRATVYGLVIPFMVVSYICVILRIYTRIKLRCLGWDDLFVVLFRISATVGSIFLCLSLNNGFGEHILTIGYDNIVAFQQKFYVCLATYTISTTLVKLCLLSQYLRIFEAPSRARTVCWIGLAVAGTWGVGFSFCALFPCFPVSGFWNWNSPAHCYGFGSKVPEEIAGTFAGHTGSNAVLDALVLAIPVPLYFRKSTAWRQRFGIGILLILGLVVNLLSIWRLQTIVASKAGTYPVLDPTWYGPKSIILAALEVDLASICASIPTFWPALTHAFLNTIFITQEVHITHQHRRLSSASSSSHFDLQQLSSLERGRQDNKAYDRHYRDDFVLQRVIPANMIEDDGKDGDKGAEARGGSQVRSEGHRGFKRECERLRLVAVESNNSSGKSDHTKTKKIMS
ncbi:putative integral membrane protein [Daldinia childiae]|uniref:putative integral membrane protein n=1 Tax=Daldinia childiae TaxID=326645 RepID=UPI001444DBAA|nr:putative integral membrane protein [Daldinia childiae]KAF3070988.1 putative integral membrane protein [Daldinia childiae]